MNINKLKDSIEIKLKEYNSTPEKLQFICDYLKTEIQYYDWVGFYFKMLIKTN